MKLSPKEKSIAILVRENWQADMIRTDCARLGISVHASTLSATCLALKTGSVCSI